MEKREQEKQILLELLISTANLPLYLLPKEFCSAVLSFDPAGVSCFRANEMQIRCDFLQVIEVDSPSAILAGTRSLQGSLTPSALGVRSFKIIQRNFKISSVCDVRQLVGSLTANRVQAPAWSGNLREPTHLSIRVG